jgi:molecular chaperone Hsp33
MDDAPTTPPTTLLDINESQGFLLEDVNIRGALVRLGSTWRRIAALHRYPADLDELLGEGLAATVLLASGLKSQPSVSLQLQGAGRLRLLLAQCTGNLRVRGMAQLAIGASEDDAPQPLLGEGRLVVNLDTGQPKGFFQGIVPLVSQSLERCLESYFEQSEQLATRLVLRNTGERVAGLLLQVLPGRDEGAAGAAFAAVAESAARVATADLVERPAEELLPALFTEHAIRLFSARGVAHDCRCTPERLAGVLRMLGRDELDSLLTDDGHVELNCEFCNRAFRYDEAAVNAALGGAAPNATMH